MAKRNRVIGYVVVDLAEGKRHINEQIHATQAEADQIAKLLNARVSSTRFASHPTTHPENTMSTTYNTTMIPPSMPTNDDAELAVRCAAPTMRCPAPSRALLAAARRHDAMTSAAVIVRIAAPVAPIVPRPARRMTRSLRRDLRVAIAAVAFVALPFVAHAGERCDAYQADGKTYVRCGAPTETAAHRCRIVYINGDAIVACPVSAAKK